MPNPGPKEEGEELIEWHPIGSRFLDSAPDRSVLGEFGLATKCEKCLSASMNPLEFRAEAEIIRFD